MNNLENAKILCDAIKNFNKNPEALENFEYYLSCHFDIWMKKFAYDPDSLTSEFKQFSEMDV